MKKFTTVLCCLAALCAGQAAFAKKAPAPTKKTVPAQKVPVATGPRYEGVWASPDCGSDSLTMIFTPHYVLKSTEASSSFSDVAVTGGGKDYDVVSYLGAARAVTKTEDGLLVVGAMEADDAKAAQPATWDALSLDGRSEYAHCAAVSSVVPVPLARVMQKLEAVRGSCGADATPACGKLLFSIADSNGNRRLSLSEFKKMGALLGTFIPLLGGKPVQMSDLEAAYMKGIDDGERVANKVLGERADIAPDDLAAALEGLDDPVWLETRKKLTALFPGFAPGGAAVVKRKLEEVKKALSPILDKVKTDNTRKVNR